MTWAQFGEAKIRKAVERDHASEIAIGLDPAQLFAVASRKAHEHKPIPGCPLDHYHGAPALGNACIPPDEPPDESS